MATILCTAPLHSQALPTEQKAADFQVGGGYAGAKPDYTGISQHFYGPNIYFDFDVRHHLGLEGSFTLLNQPAPNGVTEKTYQIGIRYRFTDLRHLPERIVPYARFNYGRGVFNYGYTSVQNPASPGSYITIQNADLGYNMYSIGGGIDFALTRSINIRAIDYQYQSWLNFQPGSLSPAVLSVGAAYHFH